MYWLLLLIPCLFFLYRKKNVCPIYSRLTLLTPAEARYFKYLKTQTSYNISTKVRLADIVSVKVQKHLFWKYFSQISQKHIDFVLYNDSGEIIQCIELDDKSHLVNVRKNRDVFVDKVLSMAGIELKRVKVKNKY